MQIQKTEPIKTMLTITVGFMVVFLITKMNVFLLIALMIGLIGMFSTFLSGKVDYLWMKLTWILGMIVPNILLTVIFYFFLFPVAIISRIFGKKNTMHLKNTDQTLFKDKNKTFDKASFENPW